MKIEFYGYNDGKSIAVHNHINLITASIYSLLICLPLGLMSLLMKQYYLLFIFMLPIMFFILSFVVFLFVNYDSHSFLQGQTTKHRFLLENGCLFKNKTLLNKQIKSNCISLINLYF